MQKYTPEEYNKILDKIPPILRETVLSMDTTNLIWKIGEEHRLQFDKIGLMHDLIMDTLMGIVSVKNLPSELSKELDIPSAEITPIISEVDEKIFKPMRLTMEKFFNGGSPNKLRTISTIDENDDEHLHLTKHDILREIENPSPAEGRKVESFEVLGAREVKKPEISKTTEIEEYAPELSGNKIDIKKVESEKQIQKNEENGVKLPEISIATTLAQKTITEMKLSGITNMEKGKEIAEESKKEEPAKTKIDPYREPIG